MTITTLHSVSEIPPACVHAREVFGLRLAGEKIVDAAADAHIAQCTHGTHGAGCATVTARMTRVWQVAGEVLPAQTAPTARLDAILSEVLTSAAAPAPLVPLSPSLASARRPRASREGFAFATGLALAATIAAVALLGPALVGPPVESIARVVPAPAVRAPRVTLTAARGEVSHVPADGSVVGVPKAGDVLPPGLFAATGGAALSIEGEGLLAVRGDAAVVIGGVEGAPEISIARGEIFVDLPKGTIRTFVVRTPTGAVHVTGTQFDVKVRGNETAVEVTRGSVMVKGPGGERAVTVGEAAILRNGTPIEGLVTSPAEDPQGWVRDLAPTRVGPAPVVAIAPRPTRSPDAGSLKVGDDVIRVAGLDKLVVENAMAKREAAIRYCYEQALVKAPELVVRAALRFRIDGDGRAKDITLAGLPAGQEKLGGCMEAAAKAAVFPPTAPGTEVTVSYPVKLQPAAE